MADKELLCLYIFLIPHSRVSTFPLGNSTCAEPLNYDDAIADAISTLYSNSSFVAEMVMRMKRQSVWPVHERQDILSSETSEVENEYSCPWIWRMTYDEERVPALIEEADCVCEHCKVRDSSSNLTEREGAGKCRPVVGPVLVIRKVCDPGREQVYIYKAALQNVALGCTCQLPMLA